ncbi:MAG: hypothetical protein ACRD96_08470, partial [Bryobacteraceae bacterium]
SGTGESGMIPVGPTSPPEVAALLVCPDRMLAHDSSPLRASEAVAAAVLMDVGTDREAAQVPVVALHRTTDPESIRLCLRYGAREFRSPPFQPDDVQQRAGVVKPEHLTEVASEIRDPAS